ncbi:glycerophosphodiester phosphodiesterase family protein, partial [Bordetella pertussis]|uniref:glycerophosphodiester phosphodiesterase family protein n=1 Tax=Bordetella pertussis TaxID=520 RepID=UPI000A66A4DB
LWQDALPAPLLSSFAEPALHAARGAAPQRDASRELVDAVHQAGYRIAAWTVNDPARARLLLDWGMDAIFTDELATIRPAV